MLDLGLGRHGVALRGGGGVHDRAQRGHATDIGRSLLLDAQERVARTQTRSKRAAG